jgi:hypothetical protein
LILVPNGITPEVRLVREFQLSELDPLQIVEAFDECMIATWGAAGKRAAPFRDDELVAQQWIDAGATLTKCIMIFTNQMEIMRQKKMRLPRAIKIFDSNIRDMIARDQGEEVDVWECEYSRWRSRCRGWVKNPALWRENHWGPPPFALGNRVPGAILREIDEDRKRDLGKERAESGLVASSARSRLGSVEAAP